MAPSASRTERSLSPVWRAISSEVDGGNSRIASNNPTRWPTAIIRHRAPSLIALNKRPANAWALAESISGFFVESDIKSILRVYIVDANALRLARPCSTSTHKNLPRPCFFNLLKRKTLARNTDRLGDLVAGSLRLMTAA